VGYSANPFTRVRNLVTGRGAEMWDAEEGCTMHAEFLLQYFLAENGFNVGIVCVWVCVCECVSEWVCVCECVCVSVWRRLFMIQNPLFGSKICFMLSRTNALPHRPDTWHYNARLTTFWRLECKSTYIFYLPIVTYAASLSLKLRTLLLKPSEFWFFILLEDKFTKVVIICNKTESFVQFHSTMHT
jgi:hypothetical protein